MLRALMILAAPSGLAATALLFGASWHIVAVAYVMVGMSSSALLAMIVATYPNKLGHIEAETERDILALQARHKPSLSELEAEYIEGRDTVRLQLRSALAARPTLESDPRAARVEVGQEGDQTDRDLSREAQILSQTVPNHRHSDRERRFPHQIQ